MSKNGKTSKNFFYRATLYVFAILQRPRSRPVSVCPSVRLSVTFVYCIEMAEDIVKLLSRLGSPVILVFLTPGAGTQFQGEPLQRGRVKYTGWVGKFCDFRLKSPSISETVRDRPMVTMERE